MSNPFGAPVDAQVEDDWSVDCTDVKSGFNIEPGLYLAKCIDIKRETSKSSGQPMFTLSYVIMEGPEAGKEFKSWCSLSPKALFKVAETGEAMGLGGAGSVVKLSPDNVLNKAVTLKIEDSLYNGETRSSIAKVLPHPNGPKAYLNNLSGVAEPAIPNPDNIPY